MRRTALLGVKKKRVAVGASIPAPVEGWDAISPLATMSPKRAVILDNWIPRQTWVELREGYTIHVETGGDGPVESLMAYQALTSADDALFAVCQESGGSDYSIFNVTVDPVSEDVTGLSNARFQHVNYTTTGGHYLYAVNGEDDPQIWDGTSWTTPTITVASATTFIHINVFKKRLFFCAINLLGFWYLPVDSIQGAAAYFELGNVFSQGGYLMAMGTWTIDGGAGVDDYAVFMSSRGQTAIYRGTNPADATAWSLVGVFNLPPPIGRRCMTKVGGDLYIITVSGVIPLARSLILDKAAVNNVTITKNIMPIMMEAAQNYGMNYGWQMIAYPAQTLAILNVPLAEDSLSYQFVMNTLSGAWCRFKGWNAICWELLNDIPYFGMADGKVCLPFNGATDDSQSIVGDMVPAFNYFGERGLQKRFTMIRPLYSSDDTVTPEITLNVDFQLSPPSPIVGNLNRAIFWDEFDWDEADWPPLYVIQPTWQTVSGIGYAAAVWMRVEAYGTVQPVLIQVNSFDIIYEKGGLI